MNYSNTKTKVELGDKVRIDFDTEGVVVCDFDSWQCLAGYETWLTKDELVGGGYLTHGVMVETEEIGFLHCSGSEVTIDPININKQ